jgi:putative transposase
MKIKRHNSSNHAVHALRYHLVLVTKYRKKVLEEEMLTELENIFGEVLLKWRCRLLEFGGESDHVHLLVEAHPALQLSNLVNNLKTASSRRLRNRYRQHIEGVLQPTRTLAPSLLRC